jgi:MFS family permease
MLISDFKVSFGIGGEWAAGASMVAEVVPESRRIECGALLYTAAPCGLLGATFVSNWFLVSLFNDNLAVAWRYVFLLGLIPAACTIVLRLFISEPDKWKNREFARCNAHCSQRRVK